MRRSGVEGRNDTAIMSLIFPVIYTFFLMRTDQPDQEASEDRINVDDAGQESRAKSHEHSQGYDGLIGAILSATRLPQNPEKGGANTICKK